MNEKGTRAPSWVWIVLVIAVIVSLGCGLIFGGVGGYLLGRSSFRHMMPYRYEYEYRYDPPIPRIPESPEVPRVPVVPRLGRPEFASGALITYVVPDSPAYLAELRVGDVIHQVDGKNLSDDYTLADGIRAKKPGDRVTLAVWRPARGVEGESIFTVNVSLAEHPDERGVAYLGVNYITMRGSDMAE